MERGREVDDGRGGLDAGADGSIPPADDAAPVSDALADEARAEAALVAGDWDEAEACFTVIRDAARTNHDGSGEAAARMRLAAVYIRSRRFEEVIETLRLVPEAWSQTGTEPRYGEAQYLMGLAGAGLKEYTDALTHFATAAKHLPSNHRTPVMRAYVRGLPDDEGDETSRPVTFGGGWIS